jgi:hypothetical protein
VRHRRDESWQAPKDIDNEAGACILRLRNEPDKESNRA